MFSGTKDVDLEVRGFSGAVLVTERCTLEQLPVVVRHFQSKSRVLSISASWFELQDTYVLAFGATKNLFRSRKRVWERFPTERWVVTDNLDLINGCPHIDLDKHEMIESFRAEVEADAKRFSDPALPFTEYGACVDMKEPE